MGCAAQSDAHNACAGLSMEPRCGNNSRRTSIEQETTGTRMKEDLKAATKTYGGFIASLKWSVPLIAVLTFLVIIMISE